jgi:Zn-dependent protease with chaperone function
MTTLLLALLLTQPFAEDSSLRAVESALAVQLRDARQLFDEEPARVLKSMTALLDDPRLQELERLSPTIHRLREQALILRGEARLRQGEAQTVVDEMTALLDRKQAQLLARIAALTGSLGSPQAQAPLRTLLSLPPGFRWSRADWIGPLTLRARAHYHLEQHDEVAADQARSLAILSEITGRPQPSDWPSIPPTSTDWPSGGMDWGLSWLASPFVPLVLCLVMVPVFCLVGRRQRRDAGGTWLRLLLVSSVLAVLQTVPLFVAALLAWLRPEALPLQVLHQFPAFILFVFNGVLFGRYLATPRWQRSSSLPPLLEDAAVLERIRDIAAQMGLDPPVTRLIHSGTSRQENQAFLAGLAAPTLLLHDGILNRLSGEERDAIIAHELAHFANHTFWYWLVAATACSVAVVVVAASLHLTVALAFGYACYCGLALILSRWLELDCDRRAARAIGHRRAASALWKIHADQPFRGRPVLEFLIGATSSHPSRDERLAAIHQTAPAGDKPEINWNPRLLSRRRLAAWSACALWLAILLLSLFWGYRESSSILPALPLFAVAIAPWVVLWLGFRGKLRRQARLQRQRRHWTAWLGWLGYASLLLMLGFILVDSLGWTRYFLGPDTSLIILVASLLASVTLPFLSRWLGGVQRLERQVAIAFLSGDPQRALDLCASNPAVVARSSVLRYNQALARALLGRRDEAIHELEQLRRDAPSFKMTWLALIALYGDEGEYERALVLSTELTRDLPDEPAGRRAEAWLLRKLGRLDEAEQRAREALALEPETGLAHVVLAGIALDRGDPALAREQLACAERLAPGTVEVSLLEAEIALASDDPNAEAVVQRAFDAVRKTPLAFAEKEAAALGRRLPRVPVDSPAT